MVAAAVYDCDTPLASYLLKMIDGRLFRAYRPDTQGLVPHCINRPGGLKTNIGCNFRPKRDDGVRDQRSTGSALSRTVHEPVRIRTDH